MGFFLKKSASSSRLHSAKSAPGCALDASSTSTSNSAAGYAACNSKASNDWVFEPLSPLAAATLAQMRPPVRRSSAPLLHVGQSAQAASDLMSNPPVFNNPLRRRGCCDHAFSEELTEYRHEAIRRELQVSQQSLPGRSQSLDKQQAQLAA